MLSTFRPHHRHRAAGHHAGFEWSEIDFSKPRTNFLETGRVSTPGLGTLHSPHIAKKHEILRRFGPVWSGRQMLPRNMFRRRNSSVVWNLLSPTSVCGAETQLRLMRLNLLHCGPFNSMPLKVSTFVQKVPRPVHVYSLAAVALSSDQGFVRSARFLNQRAVCVCVCARKKQKRVCAYKHHLHCLQQSVERKLS